MLIPSPHNNINTMHTTLLDINEASTRLHVCKRMIYRLVQKKDLPPPVKVGGKSLFLETDIEGFIARRVEARNSA